MYFNFLIYLSVKGVLHFCWNLDKFNFGQEQDKFKTEQVTRFRRNTISEGLIVPILWRFRNLYFTNYGSFGSQSRFMLRLL